MRSLRLCILSLFIPAFIYPMNLIKYIKYVYFFARLTWAASHGPTTARCSNIKNVKITCWLRQKQSHWIENPRFIRCARAFAISSICFSFLQNDLWSGRAASFHVYTFSGGASERAVAIADCATYSIFLYAIFVASILMQFVCLNCVINLKCVREFYGWKMCSISLSSGKKGNKDEYHSWNSSLSLVRFPFALLFRYDTSSE